MQTDYNADGSGSGDQTAALQNAINDLGSGGDGDRQGNGVTKYPAEVYLPGGTYTLGSTLELRVGTIITGDPLDLPVLKAAEGFNGGIMVKGYDKGNGNAETSFMTLMRNVKLDTTALGADVEITALQWGVAQGAGLTNVKIEMPENSSGHTGIDIQSGSTIAVTDVVCSFMGSGVMGGREKMMLTG